MAPHTDFVPKALIPVAGKPFADWQLAWLAAEGVTDVTYSIGYLGDQIRRHVGSGESWGLRVRYVDDGRDARGTGGAVRLAVDQREVGEQFLVLYGDSYLSLDIRDLWNAFTRSNSPAMMTVYRNDGAGEPSNACLENGLVTRYDKGAVQGAGEMRYIDYGLSMLRRSTVVEWVPRGETVDLATIFTRLSETGRLAGYEVEKRYFEVGSKSGLRELEQELLGR
jgi:NDP-sugar pyrophosphorylase family protein